MSWPIAQPSGGGGSSTPGPLVTWAKVDLEGAATDVIGPRIYYAATATTITRLVWSTSYGGIEASDALFAQFQVNSVDAAGGPLFVVGSKTTQTVGEGGTGNIAPYASFDLDLQAELVVPAGGGLYINITKVIGFEVGYGMLSVYGTG